MVSFYSGRRWFLAGSWALVLAAVLHALGNLLPSPPTDSTYATLETAMRSYRLPLGLGMVPSMWDINQSLVFTMSICLMAMGLLGVVIGTSRDTGPRLLQTTSLVLALSSMGLTVLFFAYHVTPALVSMAVVTLCFTAAAFGTGAGGI